MRFLTPLFLVIFISACSSLPTLNTDPIKINSKQELSKYWSLPDGHKYPRMTIVLPLTNGKYLCFGVISDLQDIDVIAPYRITHEVIIDSKGRIFDRGNYRYSNESAKNLLSFLSLKGKVGKPLGYSKFFPSSSNVEKTPIILDEVIGYDPHAELCKIGHTKAH